MAITEIIQFNVEPLLDAQVSSTTVDNVIQKAVNNLKGAKTSQPFVFATQVLDKNTVQITSEFNDFQDNKNFETAPESSTFIKSLRSSYGEPHDIFHVALDRSAFGPDGPATANMVECVLNYFAVSRVTPEFQKQVEEDFLKFDEIYSQGADGNLSWAFGWVMEEQEHENIKGEKAKCFFIIRGWESMDHFEKSIQNDAYKKAIPLLFAWNAPWKMWHVERKALNNVEFVA